MVLDYTITDKMIAYVASVSEKTGRIKEIRNANGHIDFDRLCNVKNIQNALEYKNILCPKETITGIIDSKPPIFCENEELKTIEEVVRLYSMITDVTYPKFESFAQVYNRNGAFARDMDDIIQRQDDFNHFFLYHMAEFCNDCYYKVSQVSFVEIWLIILLYHKYGMLLYFPYDSFFKQGAFIDDKGVDLFNEAQLLSERIGDPYPMYEFYLSVIDRVLDRCIDFHYELVRPVAGRVEMLKGVIKEPFSRKDYMAYHKVSAATASLDLRKAVENGILSIKGDKRLARYRFEEVLKL